MPNFVLILILLLLLGTLAMLSKLKYWINKFRKKTVDTGTTYVEQDDASIQKLKEKAQAELPYLIEFMQEHHPDEWLYHKPNKELFHYYVKSGFLEDDVCEHMWSKVDAYKDGIFSGELANDPNNIEQLKAGDKVLVKSEDIEDWILQDNLTNTKVGHYSKKFLDQKRKRQIKEKKEKL